MIKIVKEAIPTNVKDYIRNKFSFIFDYKLKQEIKKIRESQKQIVRGLRKKEKLNVIFLAFFDSVWKYEEVYRLMDRDPRFDVQVVVIPHIVKGEIKMNNYNRTLNFFTDHLYNTVSSFNKKMNIWLDIKEITKPDIVFFTLPYSYTFKKYTIDNFLDKLTCFVPYTFDITTNFQLQYNGNFHNILWQFFVETKDQLKYAKEYSLIPNRSNVLISGFIGLDYIYSFDYIPKNVWKNYIGGDAKKIIWAPHHTIPNHGANLDYSCFLNYADYFIELLDNRNDIQIAFKPHPLLKEKLYNKEVWGKEKTDLYYKKWDTLPNGQLENGNYINLFYFSDAMILDSASFTVEYLFFNKPSLFTIRDENLMDRFNSFGHKVFDYLYKAYNKKDIDKFIENVIFGERDYLKNKRERFVKEELLPKNGNSASLNLYNEILKELNK